MVTSPRIDVFAIFQDDIRPPGKYSGLQGSAVHAAIQPISSLSKVKPSLLKTISPQRLKTCMAATFSTEVELEAKMK